LIDDDYDIAFDLCLVPISRRKFVVVFNASFFSKYKERTSHNMLCLMLEPRFKNLYLFIFVAMKKM
jgi:hypothetical protein